MWTSLTTSNGFAVPYEGDHYTILVLCRRYVSLGLHFKHPLPRSPHSNPVNTSAFSFDTSAPHRNSESQSLSSANENKAVIVLRQEQPSKAPNFAPATQFRITALRHQLKVESRWLFPFPTLLNTPNKISRDKRWLQISLSP